MGHLPASTCLALDIAGVDASLQEIHQHSSQPWYNMKNRKYILQNVVRHSLEAELYAELWSIVLDPKWTYAQMHFEGLLAVIGDFNSLATSAKKLQTARTSVFDDVNVDVSFETMSRCLKSSYAESFRTVRALSFSFLSRILEESRKNSLLHFVKIKVESSTPAPFLVPVASPFPDASECPEPDGIIACFDYSPYGLYIACATSEVVVVGKEAGGGIWTTQYDQGYIEDLKFSSSSQIVCASRDGTIAAWVWESTNSMSVILKGNAELRNGIALSSDASKLYSVCDVGLMKVWNVSDGKCIETVDTPWGNIACIAAYENMVAFVHGGKSGELRVLILDLVEKSKTSLRSLLLATRRRVKAGRLRSVSSEDNLSTSRLICYGVTSIEFSKDGKLLAFGSEDGSVQVLKTNTWTQAIRPLQNGHTDAMRCLAFNLDSQRLALSSDDGYLRVWNVENGKIVGVVDTGSLAQPIACSPDGQTITFCNGSDEFCTSNIELLQNFPVWQFSLSGDGKRVLVLTEEGKCILQNALDGQKIFAFSAPEDVSCIALDQRGRYVAYGLLDATVEVRDTEKSSTVAKSRKMHQNEVTHLSFCRDGSRIVSIGKHDCILTWNVTDESNTGCILASDCRDVALSSDAKLVIHTDQFGVTQIWKTDTQEPIFRSGASSAGPSGLPEHEALAALFGSGPKASFMWPHTKDWLAGDVFVSGGVRMKRIYYVEGNEKKLLAVLPCLRWEFM